MMSIAIVPGRLRRSCFSSSPCLCVCVINDASSAALCCCRSVSSQISITCITSIVLCSIASHYIRPNSDTVLLLVMQPL